MRVKVLAAIAFTAFFLFSLVNLSLLQLQIWLWGRILFPQYLARIGMYVVAAVMCFIVPQWRMPKGMMRFWVPLALALVATFVVVRSRGEMRLPDQMLYLVSNYYSLALVPFCLWAKPFLKLGTLFKLLLLVLFPLCIIGIAQYWLNNPLLPTEGGDSFDLGMFIDFNGQVRAFSLFPNGLHFAYFLALMMAFLVTALRRRSGKLIWHLFCLLSVVLIIVATYATVTRLAFLVVAFSAFFAVLFSGVRKYSKFSWFSLPILALAIGGAIIGLSPFIASHSSNDVYSDASLVERLFHWGVALNTWLNSGSSVFIFGNGISQGKSADYIVDNTFLNFAVQGGLVGLITSLAFMHFIWMSLRPLINGRPATAPVVAICAFWATWLLTGLFNTTNAIYGLIAAPLFVSPDFTGLTEGRSKHLQSVTEKESLSVGAVPLV